LRWIGNWLQGRKQGVVLDGEVSEWCDILSGVPHDIFHNTIYSSNWKKVVKDDINTNYLRKDLDLILENFVSVIELWIYGILYMHDV